MRAGNSACRLEMKMTIRIASGLLVRADGSVVATTGGVSVGGVLSAAGEISAVTTRLTAEGGIAVRMINRTGAPSVKGTVVCASIAHEAAVMLCPGGDNDPIGVMYEAGVVDGDGVWVVTLGPADVLLEDGTESVRGNWIRVSSGVAGRAYAGTAQPPGGGIAQHDLHFTEVGHAVQTVAAGVDKLCRAIVHFN